MSFLRWRRQILRFVYRTVSGRQFDEFCGGISGLEVEKGEGYRQRKTAGTGTAGVEVEDAVFSHGRGFVGVAEEDYVDLCGGWIQVEIVEAVEHIEEAAT